MASEQPKQEVPQSGAAVALRILAFLAGTVILLLIIKYLMGM